MQQDQQHRTELSQLRSAAEYGNLALISEIRQLGQSTLTQPRQDDQTGEIFDNSEPYATTSISLQQPKTDQNDSSEHKDYVLRKKRSRPDWRKGSYYRLNLAWFTGKLWDIAAVQAENGWKIQTRTWNLVSPNSDIFSACREGDLRTVQKLLKSGAASIYDLSPETHRVTSTLHLFHVF